MNADFRYRNKALLWLLLIVLNIIIRIPSASHEIGGDTYQLHSIANSLTQFGEARWWSDWLSIFGMSAYSYASAVPFSLSGISQLTGTDMEITVYLFALLLGLLSTSTVYIMAGTIYDGFISKYLMALFYSISAGILAFTSWNASARGLFLVLFPLFIFVLLKKFSSGWKKLILTAFVFIYLRATHNFVYFAIPLMVVFIFIKIVTGKWFTFKDMKATKYQNYLFLFITCILFVIPFFTKLFITGSKYRGFITILITTTRYIGPIIAFVIPGFLYLALKNNRTKEENVILLSSLFFIPIFFSPTYGKFVILPLAIFYISIAVKNAVANKIRFSTILLILLICSLTLFSSFYSHFRSGESDEYFQMSEYTNAAGIWSRNYIPENSRAYTTNAEIARMAAVSNGHIIVPMTPPLSLIYGYVEDVNNSSTKQSYLSKEFYFEGASIPKSGTLIWGSYNWYSNFGIKDLRVKDFMDKYDIKYIVEDNRYYSTKLTNSLEENKNFICNNGRTRIWMV
ncbi:hypothetical protein [Methanosarcina mazei]|uniref:Glycosyltransferase RgtA/B/C/D-like domain-containing protein n=1 Tax=Methanosarcina mazei TaxID=2209 RepID=A0A0F8C9U1_METMZ|nr:hypothetical protein [Methanosarcina mazei]KKG11801.1 hypothetical protein DU34_04190 [Methanosarcina mazei]